MPSNWDDLRIVLTLVEFASLNRAARTLRREAAEVLQAVEAYEASVGQVLFDRDGDRFALTTSGRRIVMAAREVMHSVEQSAPATTNLAARGVAPMSISTMDCVNHLLLVQVFQGLPADMPLPVVTLGNAQEVRQLDHLANELVVRPGKGMADDLDADVAGYFDFAVYERSGGRNAWLGHSGVLLRSPAAQWYKDRVDPSDISLSSDSFLTLAAMAEAGLGRVLLPSYVGNRFPALKRYEMDLSGDMIPLSVGNHPDLSGSRRLTQLKRSILHGLRHAQDLAPLP
ncbi:LysR family transcriptional regulator [Thalassobius sp. MITS945101]|uniref:LysR family transcriptional regulator n=1 Tax=Thalassobius sp. MITS945101 TaxID=3096994 RepID=UPI00399B3634